MKTIGPQTRQAIDLCAQMDRLNAQLAQVKAEQLAARERREELTEMLDRMKKIEAAGERTRAARTARFGPYIFD